MGGLAVHTQGGVHTRRYTLKAVHTEGGLWPPQESCYLGGGLRGLAPASSEVNRSMGGWRSTHKAVHTEGGAHKRRSVATAGVLLLKGGTGAGPRVERSEPKHGGLAVRTQGGAHTRWYTQKAVHTKGGLWPPEESCNLRGPAPAWSEASRSMGGWRSAHKAVRTQGGTHRRRCTQKAVCGHQRSLVI